MKSPLYQTALDSEISDALADALSPVELSNAQRDRMRSRILKRATAPAPSGMLTLRAHEGQWRALAPGVHMKVLREDPVSNAMTYLVRMEPGAQAPVHEHRQAEECLVLEGEVHLGDHVIRSGDWHVALPGSTHSDFWSSTGCLLLIRSEVRAAL